MNPWSLTEAEERVMDALCQIGVDKQIARSLGTSPRTVENQLLSIRKKMGCKNRVLTAVWWDRYRRSNGQTA